MTMPPHNKLRSNSDGDTNHEPSSSSSSSSYSREASDANQQMSDDGGVHRRASSSDAKLPSAKNSSTDIIASGAATELSDATIVITHHQLDVGVTHQHSFNSKTTTQRPPLSTLRCQSDTTNSYTVTKRLQTITSGIALDESSEASSPTKVHSPSSQYHQMQQQQQQQQHPKSPHSSPLPPLPLHHRKSLPSTINGFQHQQYYLQQPHNIPPIPNIDSMDFSEISQFSQQSKQSHRSNYSHYSVDAGKHGFLSHANSNIGDGSGRRNNSNDNDSTDGSANGGDSIVDSIVFKYTPGEEVPPAEYALPASILKVYGVDCDEYEEGMMVNHHGVVGLVNESIVAQHKRYESDGTNGTNESFSSGGSALEGEVKKDEIFKSINEQKGRQNDDKDAKVEGKSRSYEGEPSARLQLIPPSTHLTPSEHQSQYEHTNHQRILPYHERKRLMELEEERSRHQNARLEAKRNNEKTPLNGRQSRGYNVNANTNRDGSNQRTGWFGQLAAIVSGNQSRNNQQHKRYGSIEDESKQYRDRAEAFLKKTQVERRKMKEMSKTEELNNVNIPVNRQGSL
jgi:hypothetical protein